MEILCILLIAANAGVLYFIRKKPVCPALSLKDKSGNTYTVKSPGKIETPDAR